ncbi:Spo0B domain-containing protein [Ornithinibacillus xuwenensis]|uniref:Spo0B domain-containing protein n=1 Tax=Ornithinibacillus xuwenensis TaxID=3144668 RepID=A0ABU9XC75_9BACI
MEAKDVIQLLRLQRHDLMNDMQIVHGYLSMGKTEKVKAKVSDIIEAFNQERLLMNINCPKFALWLIQLKWLHNNIRFTYDIHTEIGDLEAYDDILTNLGHVIIESLLEVTHDSLQLIEGMLQLKASQESIDVITTINGQTIDRDELKTTLRNKVNDISIQVTESDADVVYVFSIPA